MPTRTPIGGLVLALVAGCGGAATPSPAPVAAPDHRPVVGDAPPAAAGLYADCLAQAIAARAIRHAHEDTTDLLLFTCDGEPARAFYDALATWSARIGSQFEHDGRTYRTTAPVKGTMFGVDYCATDATSYACVVTLNVGPFVTGGDGGGDGGDAAAAAP